MNPDYPYCWDAPFAHEWAAWAICRSIVCAALIAASPIVCDELFPVTAPVE